VSVDEEERAPGIAGLTARSATITAVAQAGGRAITLGVVVVSTAVVARTLAVDTYADWATVLSLVALVGFALDPGLSPVVVRRLAQHPDQAPTPAAMTAVRVVLALIALGVIVILTGALRGTSAVPLAAVLGAQVVPRALVLNAAAWLQADHRLHRQTAWEAVCAGVGCAALVLVGALGGSAPFLALAGFTAPTVLLALLIRRELARTPSAHLPSPGPEAPKVRSVLLEVAPLAGALLLVATYTRIFVVFVNAAEDTAAVAQYLFAFQFIEQLIVVAGIVAGTLLPLLAVRARAVELLADASMHSLVLAVTAFGGMGSAVILALAPPLCRLIGGPHLAPAEHYLTLLAPMAAIVMPAFGLGYLYVAVGAARRYLWFNAAGLLFNVAANAWLTLTFGASATARIAWGTELLVVTLAMLPLVQSGRSGQRHSLRMIAIVAACVAGAELAAAGDVARGLAAGGVLVCSLLAGGRDVLAFAAKARRS
jgi:O-antigen/teichoic acid export membrane protein